LVFLLPTTSEITISGQKQMARNCAEVIMTIFQKAMGPKAPDQKAPDQKAPDMTPRRRAQRIAIAGLFLVALCSLALAQDPIFRVARISLIEGEVSYQRANDSTKDWFDATPNLPLDESDQVYSGADGRAEIQLTGRNIVRIDRNTNLRFTQFNTGTIQMALSVGSAYFRVDTLDRRQFPVVDANDLGINDPVYFEVDTPTVAVTFAKEGIYRINVRDDGATEVIVRQGQAEIYNQEIGAVVLKKGRRFVIDGRGDAYHLAQLEEKDFWDRWNDRRDEELLSRANSGRSSRYVPVSVAGVYDLDAYGDWFETSDYGWVWCPRGVDASWAPYRQGYWRWYPTYGWTWISYEPWGWAPYHYGYWAYYNNRWCWTLSSGVGLALGWGWRPHQVAFFGWGGNYSRGYREGFYDGYWNGFRDGRYGWLGWCPLSPRDRYNSSRTNANNGLRTIEALENYRAPGGVSGMDASRFTSGRVVVSRDVLNAPAPPRGLMAAPSRGDRGDAAPAFVRTDDLKPMQALAPTRNDVVTRSAGARRIEAPIVMRRTPVGVNGIVRSPLSASDGSTAPGSRTVRDGQVESGRSGNSNATGSSRISNGQYERPSRTPDYRPAERVDAPVRRSTDNDRNASERKIERGNDNNGPSRNESPARIERRSDDSPRRADSPSRPQVERRESAQPREIRRADPPPQRDNSSPRTIEKQSSPSRESAPAKAPERQSSPPARESAPARQPEQPVERARPSRPSSQ
jgi:hypothetical protein